MMGKNHALTGTITGIGVCLAAQLTITETVISVLVTTGAALLPDIDHPRSTVSNTYGPITGCFSWISKHLMGGHRMGTHSFAGILFLAAITQVAEINRQDGHLPGKVFMSFILILVLAAVVKLFKIPGWFDDMAPIPIVLGIVFLTDVPLIMVAVSLGIGCTIHMFGDMVTPQGCPVWWPLTKKKYKLSLFKTGKWFESKVLGKLLVTALTGEILFWGWTALYG